MAVHWGGRGRGHLSRGSLPEPANSIRDRATSPIRDRVRAIILTRD